jgi:hypothetical protein
MKKVFWLMVAPVSRYTEDSIGYSGDGLGPGARSTARPRWRAHLARRQSRNRSPVADSHWRSSRPDGDAMGVHLHRGHPLFCGQNRQQEQT